MEIFIIATIILLILLVLLFSKYSKLRVDYNILDKKYKTLEVKFNNKN